MQLFTLLSQQASMRGQLPLPWYYTADVQEISFKGAGRVHY
jgi:hypothetical protein